MTAFKFTILVIIALLCVNCSSYAQGHTDGGKPLAGESIDSLLISLLHIDSGSLKKESSFLPNFNKQLIKDPLLHLKDSGSTGLFLKDSTNSRVTHLVNFNRGYLSYQWIQRTGIDTPFSETNSSQHLIRGSFSAVVADLLPVRVSYFERHSNSQIFQDFRDFKIEFDANEFFNMQKTKAQKRVEDFESILRKPGLKADIDAVHQQVNTLSSTLNQAGIRKKYIDCKEMILSPDVLDTLEINKKDSFLVKANVFVALYEKVQTKKDSLQHAYDSLHAVLIQAEKNIKNLRALITGRVNPTEVAAIKDSLFNAGLSKGDIKAITEPVSAVRVFALGRTLPSFSNLTLKNTNVKGLNFEYNKNNFYAAGAAGKIDLRSRDFIYRGSYRPNQFVYSFRLGYGKKDGSHLIATYYEGRKQISLSSIHSTSLVRGSSIAGQLFLFRNTKANIEFAQSFSPYVYDSSYESVAKTFDRNSQALNIGIRSYVPGTKTKFEANYTRHGANFQNFTGYRINGAASSWLIKAEQDFFKKLIHVTGSVRKNDLANPFVIQRYNANTIIKNISAVFRRRNFPTVTLAMMPSSQYTLVGNEVYENQYQSFSGSIFHIYNIGTARSSSSLVYTQFYNSSKDSGFIYFNAKNILFNQSLDFSSFTLNSGFTHTANGSFNVTVLQAGLSHKLFKESMISYGLKLNRLNDNTDLKFGFFGNTKINLSRIGELNINMEKSYLPNGMNKLSKYEFFTIGFTRYFN